MDTNVAVRATRAAQAVMREHGSIIVDGRWGSFTEKVYRSANGGVQNAVQAVTRSFGADYTPEALYDSTRALSQKFSVVDRNWIDQSKAAALVERAAHTIGLATTALQDFLDLEPVKKVIDGRTYYNVRSSNGSFKGLFQFNADAWASAATIAPSIGSFSNVFDPWLNTLAAAAYAQFNERQVRRSGKYTGPFTGDVYYTMHNQGAGGFIRLLKGGRLEGKQSTDALRVVSSAIGRSVV